MSVNNKFGVGVIHAYYVRHWNKKRYVCEINMADLRAVRVWVTS